MTINTIIAHNWAILYSGDSTTKIRRKNSFSSSVTKKLSGLETAKRKKNEELSYHKKILDFLTSHLTKNFAQLIGSALIENGRAVKKLILFWILFCCCWCLQFSVEMHYYQCNVNFWFWSEWREVKTHFETHGKINVFLQGLNIMKNYLMCCLCLPRCLTSHTVLPIIKSI